MLKREMFTSKRICWVGVGGGRGVERIFRKGARKGGRRFRDVS